MKKNHKILVGFIVDTAPSSDKIALLNPLIKFYREWMIFLKYAYFIDPQKTMASTQLRVYDVIDNFKSDNFKLEIYRPWKKYHIVIFQKNFNTEATKLAIKLKKDGTIIILDVNVNYYNKENKMEVRDKQHKEIMEFTTIADCVISPSQYICNFIKQLFPLKDVFCVEEHLPEAVFGYPKNIDSENNKKIKFLYSGYAVKAAEILLLRRHLEKIATEYQTEYIIIADKDPEIKIKNIKMKYIKYGRQDILKNLTAGDIFLAPRDLTNHYNLGHSFSKIGQPMAAGIPIIASPVPSYLGSPAILIDNFDTRWHAEIKKMVSDKKYYEKLSKDGIDYCRQNFSTSVIMGKYLKLFNTLINVNKQS